MIVNVFDQKYLLEKLNEVKQNGGKEVKSVIAVPGSRVRLEKWAPIVSPTR